MQFTKTEATPPTTSSILLLTGPGLQLYADEYKNSHDGQFSAKRTVEAMLQNWVRDVTPYPYLVHEALLFPEQRHSEQAALRVIFGYLTTGHTMNRRISIVTTSEKLAQAVVSFCAQLEVNEELLVLWFKSRGKKQSLYDESKMSQIDRGWMPSPWTQVATNDFNLGQAPEIVVEALHYNFKFLEQVLGDIPS